MAKTLFPVYEPVAVFEQGAEQEIARTGAIFIKGEDMKTLPFYAEDAWRAFADSWNNLLTDEYMMDNGKYRLRRYSQFLCEPGQSTLTLLPHVAYSQPSYINKLNGGIERYYEPLEDHVIENPFFTGLLTWCAAMFNRLEEQEHSWNIKIHPYRILANLMEEGKPTPEGVHRDGVNYIFMMMIERSNIKGGETTLYDAEMNELGQATLVHPMDIIIANDERTMHGVTSITVDVPEQPAHRDVLVVAFTKA